MHDQLRQELLGALNRSRTGDPVRIDGDLRRLRSLDVNGKISPSEYLRIEFLGRSRTGRFSEATEVLRKLVAIPTSDLQILITDMRATPEMQHQQFLEHLAASERLVAQAMKRRQRATGGSAGRVEGRSRRVGSRLMAVAGVLLLIGLGSAAVWYGWDRFGESSTEKDDATLASKVGGDIPESTDRNSVLPADAIGDVENHVVVAMFEARIAIGDEIRWVPVGRGTAFPISPTLFLTNRHVIEFDENGRDELTAGWEDARTGEEVSILDTRVVLVGRFGFGKAREIPARVRFKGVGKNDDLAVLSIEEPGSFSCRFAPVPPQRSQVFAIGFPGVSAGLATSLGSMDQLIEKIEHFLGKDLQPDGSLDLVKLIGPMNLEPTSNDGIISKTHLQEGILQTNAIISGGNSGGPLLDANGRVVGINTWVAADNDGFGASIRSDRIREILADTAFHDQIDWSLFP